MFRWSGAGPTIRSSHSRRRTDRQSVHRPGHGPTIEFLYPTGTHTASEAASPINGIGTAGVAPEATIVALKAGNANGFFFTQEVADAMIYAGDHHLDVVNMSFFADPWLFNCKNDADQRAIVSAIGRASRYAAARRGHG